MLDERDMDSSWANSLTGELIVRTLRALGVQHFIVSPGSRSSPLTLAMASLKEHEYSVMLDERSAAFQALGRIKATGAPVALICTSGSAVAQYYPAIIEARESALPLIALTADRPPELRNCHAGQTIDQLKIFSSYPVFQAELPIPQADETLFRQVRETCRVAVEAAMGIPGGPVHLNCSFREPFLPREGARPEFNSHLVEGLSQVVKGNSHTGIAPKLSGRTLILAGPRSGNDSADEQAAVLDLSRRYGWPVLADGANPLRYGKGNDDCVITHYDRICRDPELWSRLQPDNIIQWGEPPTSKVLRQQLSAQDRVGFIVSDGKRSMNPTHGKLQWICSSFTGFMPSCSGEDSLFLQQWKEAETQAEHRLDELLLEPHAIFEGDIHRCLESVLPDSSLVCLANSLAIRDAEWFMPASSKGLVPFSQRGANGIDGTVSLARGIAAGACKPVWLVTGDLAFLHDSNGLLGASQDTHGLFVVLINNNGGGIFELLPAARQSDRFEDLFATPQNVDISSLVAAHGGDYRLHDDLESFRKHISGWNGKGLAVAEIQVDRNLSRQLHIKYLKFNS